MSQVAAGWLTRLPQFSVCSSFNPERNRISTPNAAFSVGTELCSRLHASFFSHVENYASWTYTLSTRLVMKGRENPDEHFQRGGPNNSLNVPNKHLDILTLQSSRWHFTAQRLKLCRGSLHLHTSNTYTSSCWSVHAQPVISAFLKHFRNVEITDSCHVFSIYRLVCAGSKAAAHTYIYNLWRVRAGKEKLG